MVMDYTDPVILSNDEIPSVQDDYDRFLAELWVGVVLSVLVLASLGCLCTCFLYHAFNQWQARVLEARRREGHLETGYDTESLPSYTVVGGLPSYEEAIEQLKLKQGSDQLEEVSPLDLAGPSPMFSRLSVGDLLEIYKVNAKK